MTARKPANTTAKPANKSAARKAAPVRKATSPRKTTPAKPRPPTAGQRLIAQLSTTDDTYSVKALIERAGKTADWLERLDRVINGDRREWLQLKIGTGTVEVMVDSPIREARQLQTELRHLLAEIFRQRAKIPMGDDDDDDVLTGL